MFIHTGNIMTWYNNQDNAKLFRSFMGYTIAGLVVWHFLTHNEPYNTKDLFRAIFGTMGLQLAIGKNPLAALNGFVNLVRALRGGKSTPTSVEHVVEIVPVEQPTKKKRVVNKKVVTGKKKPKPRRPRDN